MNRQAKPSSGSHCQENGHPYTRNWYDNVAQDGENIWDKPRSSGLYVFEMLNSRLIAARLARRLKPPALVADLACGRGPLAVTLAQKGYRVVGCDFSLEALRSFDRQAGLFAVPRLVSDMFHPPFAPGCFDAVVLSKVIEHLPEPLPALKETVRLLSQGGCLAVVSPYREDLASRAVTCPHCGKRFHPNGHLHSFDEHSLSGLLSSAGLEVDSYLRYHSPATEIFWSALGELPYGFWTRPMDRIFNLIYPKKAVHILMLARKARPD